MKPERRSKCPIAFSLDLFGDRWSLLILRDVLFRGATHFQEFHEAKEGIATNILSDRLGRMVGAGLLVREEDPDDRRRSIYRPTGRAVDLVPLLLEITAWGGKHDPDSPYGGDFLRRWERDRREVVREFTDRAIARGVAAEA